MFSLFLVRNVSLMVFISRNDKVQTNASWQRIMFCLCFNVGDCHVGEGKFILADLVYD